MLGTARIVWPYEDEDDIEEILPLSFALMVFNTSEVEVVFPGGLWLVPWIWKRSDRLAIGEADLLSGGSAIGKSELGSRVCIILYSRDALFCIPALPRNVDKNGITGTVRTETGRGERTERHCERIQNLGRIPTTPYSCMEACILSWHRVWPIDPPAPVDITVSPSALSTSRSNCQDLIHPMYSASLSIVHTCLLFTPLGPDHPWCASGNALTHHCACVSTWWNTVLC